MAFRIINTRYCYQLKNEMLLYVVDISCDTSIFNGISLSSKLSFHFHAIVAMLYIIILDLMLTRLTEYETESNTISKCL